MIEKLARLQMVTCYVHGMNEADNSASLWEDSLLERKPESDLKDLTKTMVAFANSVRPGHTATILIGEKDDGTAVGVTDPDHIQKKVRNTADNLYPPIVWRAQVYEKTGNSCVRVEIEYSGDTPHFGGPAWVRRGSETIKASDEVFRRLVSIRSSKVRELEQWVGKEISIISNLAINQMQWVNKTVFVEQVTEFYVILRAVVPGQNEQRRAYSMSAIDLNWDTEYERLKVFLISA